MEQKPRFADSTGMPRWERFRMCEVPQVRALLPHRGLAHAITPHQTLVIVIAAQLLRGDGSTKGTAKAFPVVDRTERIW
jgi:hypothetical protein